MFVRHFTSVKFLTGIDPLCDIILYSLIAFCVTLYIVRHLQDLASNLVFECELGHHKLSWELRLGVIHRCIAPSNWIPISHHESHTSRYISHHDISHHDLLLLLFYVCKFWLRLILVMQKIQKKGKKINEEAFLIYLTCFIELQIN